jgi:hypothetical protein
MVPAWASVVIALGVAAIGAASGVFAAYLGFFGTKFQAREAWRTRRIDAASAFAEDLVTLYIRLGEALQDVSTVSEKTIHELWKVSSEAQKKSVLVTILFGDDARVAMEVGQKALDGFADCLNALSSAVCSEGPAREEAVSQAAEHLDSANENNFAFQNEIHKLVSPKLG